MMRITRGDHTGRYDPLSGRQWLRIPMRGLDGEIYSVLIEDIELRLRKYPPSVVAATKVLLYWGPFVGQWE